MSDFMESAKNLFNTAVSRTSWETQKQLRIRSKQTEIDKLMEQRRQLMDELGMVAMNLYQQGALTDPQLSRLCASIFELDHDTKNRETQLQEIKNEPYPADQLGPSPTTNYAPPPPQPAAPPPPPPSSTPGASTGAGPAAGASGANRCPNCGNPLRPNALYCRNCGAKLR
ncbi:MAG: zinc ribbon domain-containing protein [Ktedonobacteraceae bacterium]|nr:zinc ribbon domain-containing protein [Ktedonobacteraceae bacterium]MBV9712585.1 zinc ribbon domain-containing protein [Ktedonobacteraceae bacterium]